MKELSDKTSDMNKAIVSLREEMEAVDYYNQRAEQCNDETLKQIFIHNANEEKEHAVMLMEWIRQNDSSFSKEVDEIMFKDLTKLINH